MSEIVAWHQLCQLREDVLTGTLTLAEFAADLNDVRANPQTPFVYRDGGAFFDRTYATYQMKALTRDVLLRLAGRGGKPVLRLQVAYGGGKTHTLIALLHLAERGAELAGQRTVKEFLTFAGLAAAPRARVALLPGDKIDVLKGLEVFGPDGAARRVRTLWGALAYQLAGEAGYEQVRAHDEAFTIPAEPVLVDLLKAPAAEGLGSLVLVDEALIYYRTSVNRDPRSLGTIKDFFQVLVQAVAKTERAALVASLIASEVEASDATGVQCLRALDSVFERIAEPVEPVTPHDVAEILRRRLFSRVAGDSERQAVVDAMMAGLQRLALHPQQTDQAAYERLAAHYPFHPDLIEALYQKWVSLGRFQRTRGALRLLAYALRESADHDPAPFVGPGALLAYRRNITGLSPALTELVDLCEESHTWRAALNGEMDKARAIQAGLPTMGQREVEQAVLATFLHSQPSGQRAQPHELLALLAHPAVDAALLGEGLRKWRAQSWFLVENPDVWQLGTTPNLTHMQVRAMEALSLNEIDDELRRRIKSLPALQTADPGVQVHMLPSGPRDVEDDWRLHYAILEPAYAVEPGKPVAAAVAFFHEKTGPRIFKNNVLALAPEAASVAGLREQVRRWLGWRKLEQPETYRLLTDYQKRELPKKKQEAENNLPESVVGAYRLLLALDENGVVQAHTISTNPALGASPFERIKTFLVQEERLVETTLEPELVLPGSYLGLWAEGQTTLRVTRLIEAFGQFTRLPRLLRPDSLYDTLRRGLYEGALVLRLPRADGSARTWWRIAPDDETWRRPELELQPAATAVLQGLAPELLAPERVPDLWPQPQGPLRYERLQQFFDGARAPRLAAVQVLEEAVQKAVRQGLVMAGIADARLFQEELPGDALTAELALYPAPAPLASADLLPQALPEAWTTDEATLAKLTQALRAKRGYALPWSLLVRAVEQALHLGVLAVAAGAWPCSPAAPETVTLRLPRQVTVTADMLVEAMGHTHSRTPTLRALKAALETHLLGGRPAADAVFLAAAEQALTSDKLKALDLGDAGRDPWLKRVRLPDAAWRAVAILSAAGIQRLGEKIEALVTAAPGLVLDFQVAVSAEGEAPDDATLAALNGILAEIKPGWRLG